MDDEKIIDQGLLAESIAQKVKIDFFDYFLVKPLDPIKVTKEFSKPVSKGKPSKDTNDIEAQDFDDVETEVKEVDSDYRKGIVIKLPTYYGNKTENPLNYPDIKPGNVIVFRDAAGARFDLLKDSRLLRLYDILGVEK